MNHICNGLSVTSRVAEALRVQIVLGVVRLQRPKGRAIQSVIVAFRQCHYDERMSSQRDRNNRPVNQMWNAEVRLRISARIVVMIAESTN